MHDNNLRLFLAKKAILLIFAVSSSSFLGAPCSKANEGMAAALGQLKNVKQGTASQSEIQQAWTIVAAGNGESLISILEAMKDSGPLAENWLRVGFDVIAERESNLGNLPVSELEKFLQKTDESPRARRTAYEWLCKLDDSAATRLLPGFLNDPSLELRYDAVAQALTAAKLESNKEEQLKQYQETLKYARDKGQITKSIDALKELGAELNLPRTFGYITKWHVIGPFENTDGLGFDKAYGPEKVLDLSQEYSGIEGELSWQDYVSDHEVIEKLGLVNLNKALVEKKSVLGYAAAKIFLDQAQNVELRYSSKNATKVFLNGELVAANLVYHSGSSFDQYIVPVQLQSGENQLVVKVCQNAQKQPWARPWEFQLRVTDELGGAILSKE